MEEFVQYLMLFIVIVDYPYQETYKIVYRHKVLRTLDQNLIQRVADILNVSQISKFDISIFYTGIIFGCLTMA